MPLDVNAVFTGHRLPKPRLNPFATGRVLSASATAGVTFTLPDWDPNRKFVNAPWGPSLVLPTAVGDHGSHTHAPILPTSGDLCLVVFTGDDGISKPWVIGWWPSG